MGSRWAPSHPTILIKSTHSHSILYFQHFLLPSNLCSKLPQFYQTSFPIPSLHPEPTFTLTGCSPHYYTQAPLLRVTSDWGDHSARLSQDSPVHSCCPRTINDSGLFLSKHTAKVFFFLVFLKHTVLVILFHWSPSSLLT